MYEICRIICNISYDIYLYSLKADTHHHIECEFCTILLTNMHNVYSIETCYAPLSQNMRYLGLKHTGRTRGNC